MQKPLVNKKYLLEKFPGKGGWTYAAISEIPQNKHSHFGWMEVYGSIDTFELKDYKLMPMGNGKLFLPVRAEIRKKIGKQEGDWVHIILYSDNLPNNTNKEFLLCLKEENQAYQNFLKWTKIQQKELLDWIDAAKNDKLKIERMAKAINILDKGQIFKIQHP